MFLKLVLFFKLLHVQFTQKVLFTELYQGSCSQTYTDDVMFTYNKLGDDMQMAYSSSIGFAFWMKFMTKNPNVAIWNSDQDNYVFLLSDQPGDTLNSQLFAMILQKLITETQVVLKTQKDAITGPGPQLTMQFTSAQALMIHDTWVFVWTALDFQRLFYRFMIFQEADIKPFIDLDQGCPLLQNCVRGTVSRPFLRRQQLQLWTGSRGAHKQGGTLGYTFCGQVSNFQVYPNLYQIDLENMQYFKYGIVNNNFYVIYKAESYKDMDTKIADFGPESKNAKINMGTSTVTTYSSDYQSWAFDNQTYISFPQFDLSQFVNQIYNEVTYPNLDLWQFTFSYWIHMSSNILNYHTWSYVSENYQYFHIEHAQNNGLFDISIVKDNIYCTSNLQFTSGKWTKILIALYKRPFNKLTPNSPDTPNVHFLIYDGGQDYQSDMFMECKITNDLFNEEPEQNLKFGGYAQTVSKQDQVLLKEISFFQSARILFHDTFPLFPDKCRVSIQLKDTYHCWLCSPGFYMLQTQGQVVSDCLSSMDQLKLSSLAQTLDSTMNEGRLQCALPCQTCIQSNRSFCLSCTGNLILSNNGTCICPEGTYLENNPLSCSKFKQADTIQIGTFYSFAVPSLPIAKLGSKKQIRSFSQDIEFPVQFSQVPEVVLSVIYLDQQGDLQYSFDASSITSTQFTLTVSVKAQTVITNFGIKYLAYITPPNYINSGVVYVSSDSNLGSGSGPRSDLQQVSLQNYDARAEIPLVYAYLTSCEFNAGTTSGQLDYTITGRSSSIFYLQTLTDGDGNFSKVAWNWVAFSNIFEAQVIEFNDETLQTAQFPPSGALYRYNETERRFSNKLDGNTDLMFGMSQLNYIPTNGLSLSTEVIRLDDNRILNRVRGIGNSLINRIQTVVVAFQSACDSFKCKNCKSNPFDCISCLDETRGVDSQCFECMSNYYLDGNNECQQCEHFCLTCSDYSSNCLSCPPVLTYRINDPLKSCICQSHYYDNGDVTCQMCSNRCQDCFGTAEQCYECAGDNRNKIDCSCPDNYYDDFQSQNCIQCQEPCANCNKTGCLSCVSDSNRKYNNLTQQCDCPEGGTDIIGSSYCNSCDDIKLQITMSGDYLTISVIFSQNVTFTFSNMLNDDPTTKCSSIFQQPTVKLLGTGVQCFILGQYMNITLGNNPTIMDNDILLFNQSNLIGQGCKTPLNNFMDNQVNFPTILPYPFLNVTYPTQAVTLCEQVDISLVAYQYHGRRPWLLFQWSLQSVISDSTLSNFITTMISQANIAQSQQLIIPPNKLIPYTKISFVLTATNFLNLTTSSNIDIQTYEYSSPWLSIKQGQIITVTPKQAIQITAQFAVKMQKIIFLYKSKISCDPNTFQITQQYPAMTLKFYESPYLRIPLTSGWLLANSETQNISSNISEASLRIDAMTGTSNTLYTIIAQIDYENNQQIMSAQTQVVISIVDIPLVAYIQGGDQLIYQGESIILNARIWDPNTNFAYNNDPSINVTWGCQNVQTKDQCITLFGDVQSLPKNEYSIQIDQNSLPQYNTYNFTITAQKYARQTTGWALLQITDFKVNVLKVDFAGGLLQRPIALNEILEFSLHLPAQHTPDQSNINFELFYQDQLLYSSPYYYSKIQLIPQDFITNITERSKLRISLKCTLIDKPNDTPYIFNQEFILNKPPDRGVVILDPPNGIAMQTQFTISIVNLTDIDLPFSYWFMIYMSKELYLQDLQQSNSANAFDISQSESNNYLQTYLPPGDILIVVQVTDAKGAFSNFTLEVTIESLNNQTSITDILNILQRDQSSTYNWVVGILTLCEIFKPLQNKTLQAQQLQQLGKQINLIILSMVVGPQQLALRRVYYELLSVIPEYYIQQTPGDIILFATEQLNILRTTVVNQMDEVLQAQRQLRIAQEVGDSSIYQDYFRTNSLVDAQAKILDNLLFQIDKDIGRQKLDRPLNHTEIQILQNYINKRRILQLDTIYQKDNTLIGNISSLEVQALQERNKTFTGLHIIYSRSLSLMHIIAQTMQMRLITNKPPNRWEGNFFTVSYSRSTKNLLNQYLTKTDWIKNGFNETKGFYKQETSSNALYTIYEDTLITGSTDVSVYTSAINKTSSKSSVIANNPDVIADPNLGLVIWEDRDTYLTLPSETQLDFYSTYFLSVASLRINPYYWNPNIYNYSNTSTYYKNQSFYSTMFKQMTYQNQIQILNAKDFSIAFTFNMRENFTYFDYKCVQIVTNWTEEDCQLISNHHNNTVTCSCKYLADITLIQKYIPDIHFIQPKLVQIYDLLNYLLGQVVMFKSLSFLLFSCIGLILDRKASRTIPIPIEEEKPQENQNKEPQILKQPDEETRLQNQDDSEKELSDKQNNNYQRNTVDAYIRNSQGSLVFHKFKQYDEQNSSKDALSRNISVLQEDSPIKKDSEIELMSLSQKSQNIPWKKRPPSEEKKVDKPKKPIRFLPAQKEPKRIVEDKPDQDNTMVSFIHDQSVALIDTSGILSKKNDIHFKKPKEQAVSKMNVLMQQMGKVIDDQGPKQMFDASTQFSLQVKNNSDMGLKPYTPILVIKAIFYLHELISIFIYYDASTSRFLRFLTLYMKLIVMLCIQSYLLNFNPAAYIPITIIAGEFSIFFIKIIRAELSGGFFAKFLGIIMLLVLLFCAWLILLQKVDGMPMPIADSWAINFIIAYLINTFAIDPFIVLLQYKLKIYPWAFQQMLAVETTPLVYLMYFLINQPDIQQFYKL